MRRRGAEAIEFALILPVFLVMVFGSFDYGLMFFTQFQAAALVHSSLREGTLVTPTEWERGNGGCEECRVVSGEAASERLGRIGIDVPADQLQPEIVPLLGVCALVLRAEIPYTPLVGLFSVPDHYIVSSSLPTQQVTLCDA